MEENIGYLQGIELLGVLVVSTLLQLLVELGDSKMHPALRAVAEEWIQQEHQGVQSPASILYFLPFGRALIFISENR